MSATLGEFVPMVGPVRTVFEVLTDLVYIDSVQCAHTHVKKCAADTCDHVDEPGGTFAGLEEAANRIVGMIERGELT